MKTGGANKRVTLESAYKILKNYKHVIFEEDTAPMKASMREQGLVLKVGSNVMLFPRENNETVSITEVSVCLNDVNGWKQIFFPLISAKLI